MTGDGQVPGHRRLARVGSVALLAALVGGGLTACASSAPGASATKSATGSPSVVPADPGASAAQSDAAGASLLPDAAPTSAPVGLDAVADFGAGVTVTLDGIEELEIAAQGPGEISGPGLALTLTVTNGSDAEADLGAVSVNLAGAAGAPGVIMTGAPAAPFSGELDIGGSASGVYVFAIDPDDLTAIRVEASYSTRAPTVAFAGDPLTTQ